MAFDTVPDFAGSFLQGQYAPQLKEQELQQQQIATQTNLLKLKEAQKAVAMQEQESEWARTHPIQEEFTQASLSKDGGVTSPILQALKRQSVAQHNSGNLEGYRKTLKDIVEIENKESEVLKRNMEIEKTKREHIAAGAQHALDTGDIIGGVSIYAQYDPAGAMRAYDVLSKLPPDKQKIALKKIIAENLPAKELADIQHKQIVEADKEQYRQESLELRRQAQADRRAEQAARREERAAIREEKAAKEAKKERKIGKLSDPKEVERTSDELKQDHPKLETASRNKAAEDIRTRQKELMRADEDMSAKEAYDQAYDEISSKIKDDKGYLFGFGAKSTYGKETTKTSQFEEGKVYTDAKGNKAKYVNGKWVPQ